MLVALALGLVQLGTDSLWVDDGFTLTHTSLPWDRFWQVVGEHEMNAVAYSTLMFGWVRLGDGEWWLRLPSVLFAVGAVPVVFLLGRRLFDERVGLTAASLLAVNAFVVEYAHEARTYAFTMLVVSTSMLLLVRYVQHPARGRWWAWVAVTAVVPHAHFFGLLAVGAQVVALLARGRLPTPRRGLVAGYAAVAVSALPIAVFLAAGGDQGQVDNAPALTPVRFVGAFARLVGNGGPLLLALAGVAIAVALWDAVGRLRDERGVGSERSWAFVLLVAWVAVPVLTVAALSPVKPLFGARWFLLTAPALALLTAVGAWRLPRRAAIGLLGAIVVVSLAATAAFYPRDAHDDFRAATRYVLDRAEPGDAIVFQPWFTRVTFTNYADRRPDERDRLVPLDPAPDWGEWLLIDEPPDLTAERADTLIDGHDRVWVLERAGTEDAPQADDAATMARALEARGFSPVDEQSFPGLDVTLYEAG